jgi:hypothetical protein
MSYRERAEDDQSAWHNTLLIIIITWIQVVGMLDSIKSIRQLQRYVQLTSGTMFIETRESRDDFFYDTCLTFFSLYCKASAAASQYCEQCRRAKRFKREQEWRLPSHLELIAIALCNASILGSTTASLARIEVENILRLQQTMHGALPVEGVSHNMRIRNELQMIGRGLDALRREDRINRGEMASPAFKGKNDVHGTQRYSEHRGSDSMADLCEQSASPAPSIAEEE